MPKNKLDGRVKKVVVVKKKRGRPEKELETIPATFEEIVNAVLKPERKVKVEGQEIKS